MSIISIFGDIIIALISLISVVLAAQIKQGNKLTTYRIDQLERGLSSLNIKVDKQQELEITVIEQKAKIAQLEISINELKEFIKNESY